MRSSMLSYSCLEILPFARFSFACAIPLLIFRTFFSMASVEQWIACNLTRLAAQYERNYMSKQELLFCLHYEREVYQELGWHVQAYVIDGALTVYMRKQGLLISGTIPLYSSHRTPEHQHQ